jgi:hypothetical protein
MPDRCDWEAIEFKFPPFDLLSTQIHIPLPWNGFD